MGTATLTISLVNWKAGEVAPSTHSTALVAPKWKQEPEPVSPRFVRSLIHPDRKASLAIVAFASDGRLLVHGYPSGMFQVFDPHSGKEIRSIETPRGYRGSHDYAQLSPDRRTLYVGLGDSKFEPRQIGEKKTHFRRYSGEIRAYDVKTGERRETLAVEPRRGVMTLSISPDGNRIATMEFESGLTEDFTKLRGMYLWDVPTRKVVQLRSDYGQATFSPDSKAVFVRVADRVPGTTTVYRHSVETGKETVQAEIPGTMYQVPAFSPDGKILALISQDAEKRALVQFHDPVTLRVRRKLPPLEKGVALSEVLFSPDGKHLIGLSGSTVLYWETASGKRVRSWKLDTPGTALYLAWDPSGERLAVMSYYFPPELRGARDEVITPQDVPQPRAFLIDLKQDRPETIVCPHGWTGPVAFSPDGKFLAVGGAGAVHLFDAARK